MHCSSNHIFISVELPQSIVVLNTKLRCFLEHTTHDVLRQLFLLHCQWETARNHDLVLPYDTIMTGTRTLCNGYGEKVEHKFIYAPSFPSSTHSYPGHHKYSSPLPRPTVFLSSFPLLPHTTILFSLPYLLFSSNFLPFFSGHLSLLHCSPS